MSGCSSRRSGFALLTVLWCIVGLCVLALAASLSAREATGTATHRVRLARERWVAEACLARARSALDAGLRGDHAEHWWRELDQRLTESHAGGERNCDVTAIAAGDRLDINTADGERLAALLRLTGSDSLRADSLATALLDWRDADDNARDGDSERAWYEARGRFPPRNGPIADVRELRRVRGFEQPSAVDSYLGVEPGRTPMLHAPLPVLGSLPGFGDEARSRLAEQRAQGTATGDLLAFAGSLSRPARDALVARYPELVTNTTGTPDAWIVSARPVGNGTGRFTIEARLVRAGSRAAVVRRRTSP